MRTTKTKTHFGRNPQPLAAKGSQHWLQTVVNSSPWMLDDRLGVGPIEWCSPLATDEYSEYRDDAFLERLGVALSKRSLSAFWPVGGPQWDGLGRAADGRVILIEAKAHIAELFSPSCQASQASSNLIRASLDETRKGLGAGVGVDWLERFYQYANRLAHGYLLNVLNNIPATIAFLYFTGDRTMKGPESRAEWEAAIAVLHEALGLRGRVPAFVKELFIDVESVRAADKFTQPLEGDA